MPIVDAHPNRSLLHFYGPRRRSTPCRSAESEPSKTFTCIRQHIHACPQTLTYVDLSSAGIGDVGVRYLVDALKTNRVRSNSHSLPARLAPFPDSDNSESEEERHWRCRCSASRRWIETQQGSDHTAPSQESSWRRRRSISGGCLEEQHGEFNSDLIHQTIETPVLVVVAHTSESEQEPTW